MSNFVISFEEAKKVLDAISRINNPKAVAKIVLGAQVVAENIFCAIKVLGGSEEVGIKFSAKSTDFDGNPIAYAVENTALVTILSSLSALKEAVSFGVKENQALFGVPGKAMTSLPILGEEEIPAGVALDKDSQITRFYVKSEDLGALLRGGGFATASDDKDGCGVANATLIVKDGRLVLFSCNETGSILGYSECSAEMADIETEGGSTKRADFCKEKGIENLVVPVPKKVVINLLALLGDESKVSFIITDKVIMMAPNSYVQYYAVLGAKAFMGGVQFITSVESVPVKGTAIVDNEKLKTNLSLISSFISLAKKKDSPVLIKFGKQKLMLAQTNGDGKVVIDLVASSFDAEAERRLDPDKLSSVIAVLGKGNVRIEIRDEERLPLLFTNGSLEKVSGNTKALLAGVVDTAKTEEETKAE